MRKINKPIIILSAAAIIFCLISASIYSLALFRITFDNAEKLSQQQFTVCGGELKFTGVSDNIVVANTVSGSPKQESYSFENDIACVSFCDEGICGISEGEIREGLYFYDIYFQSFDKSYSNHINLCFDFAVDKLNFAIDNDFNLYIFNLSYGQSILKFSKSGRLIKEIITVDQAQAEQLIFINGNIYCICNGTLYIIENDVLNMFYTDDYITSPCKMTGENTISDCEGKVFLINGDNAELCVDFNNSDALCCITPGYYLSYYGSSLYGNSIVNPKIYAYYDFEFDILCLYCFDSCLYAGGYNGKDFEVIKLKDSELNISEPETLPPTETEATAPASTESTSETTVQTNTDSTVPTAQETTEQINTEPATQIPTQKTTEPTTQKITQPATVKPTEATTQKITEATVPETTKPAETQADTESSTENTDNTQDTTYENLKYSSSVYEIDYTNRLICNVSTKTTVSQFKKNFSCNGEIKVFDKNNLQKTSGNVGTNMTVVFSKGSENAVYTISVKGDLTGEGNVNSLDLNVVFNHLLGIADLSSVQIISGDLNDDGVITNKDLVLIKRIINASK